MHVDVLVAEIGSTTTVISGFAGLLEGGPRFVGQGQAPTTVLEGNVTVGLRQAAADLEAQLGGKLTWGQMLASSSAAGGLKMTVHGLVYDMTVKAAREAALGAGAVLRFATAGELQPGDLDQIRHIRPNIVLLAGGVDYGERRTVLTNARHLAGLFSSEGPSWRPPVIFAGNVAAQEEAVGLLAAAGVPVVAVANVYPRIDELNIEPTRRAIQQVFEAHIVHAPGMEKVREMVTGAIIPTPGAVMNGARLLAEALGDLMVLDVGGATTDVHSVTEGSEEVGRVLVSPEPVAKRTVEGDLGVYVNARHVAETIGFPQLSQELGFDAEAVLKRYQALPRDAEERALVERLTREAVHQAVRRHAGRLKHLYGPSGRRTIAEGKDLTQVGLIIGTGGPLTRLPGGPAILAGIRAPRRGLDLLPGEDAQVLIDHDYIMAPCGVLASQYPEAALQLMKQSLGLN